ncbi:MAG: bifunctional UDP-4-keto-pentose/UDP-xylose synthase [Betaproteobacteria bacterium]|nr:bifunctional UDP-4-keto-pentose/UDP-xylose synthase [Betaproteobacteria bacterium]
MKKILILGVNGFIGHHLTRRILAHTDWSVYGMDMQSERIDEFRANARFHFFEGDITINHEWIEYQVKKCDVVLPLVAIATPADYVTRPLEVFELDFEANLPIVRACVRRGKRLIFPSTSEVYGMCADERFDPESSNLVLGPIHKQRWIYSCCKQLIDRVIWAYGESGKLDFTLFRPFNWVGPGLDDLHAAKEGSSRVITQFLGHIARGESIHLVDGGAQRRSFTDIEDAMNALMQIIENSGGVASGRIYNIGNPDNNYSIREIAALMIRLARTFPEWSEVADRVRTIEVSAESYYGAGYQDMVNRRPSIDATCADLDWRPCIGIEQTLANLFVHYRGQLSKIQPHSDELVKVGISESERLQSPTAA